MLDPSLFPHLLLTLFWAHPAVVVSDKSSTESAYQHQLLPHGYSGADVVPFAPPTKEFQLRLLTFTFHCPPDGVHRVLIFFPSVLFSVVPQTRAAKLRSALPCAGDMMKE